MSEEIIESISLEELINDITSLGVEELETPIPIPTKSGKINNFYFKNISTEQEIQSLVAAEDFKGHHWMQRVKCEILSRAVYKIDELILTDSQFVDKGEDVVTMRQALRDSLLTWGPELLLVMWKIYMIHCQNIENRLNSTFPDALVMTEYEKRYLDRTIEMMEDVSREMTENPEE